MTVTYNPDGSKSVLQFGLAGDRWDLKADKGPIVPYRLPDLLKYPQAPVFIVEGEKDVETLERFGHLATTNPMGAGSWKEDLKQYFAGRDVTLIPDADTAGEGHVQKIYENLKAVAASIKLLRLPGLVIKDKGGEDISDWLGPKHGHTNEEFVALALNAPSYEPEQKQPAKLQWLDMSSWDRQPVPERRWAIRDRVPLKQAGLFSGEGGTGKSIIELMKNVAHVIGKDWLGSMPEPGPAFYLGAEDDKDEIHIRLAAIAKHYGVTFKQLYEGGLHVLPCWERMPRFARRPRAAKSR